MIVTANIITDRAAQPEIGSNKVDKILMVVIKETGDKRIASSLPASRAHFSAKKEKTLFKQSV